MGTVAERSDLVARAHPGDAYYREAAWPIRLVEQRRLAIISRMAGDTRGRRVLEIGCGAGHVLRLFPDAALTGVDVSTVALAAAAANLDGYDVALVPDDAETLLSVEGRYDVVICSEVLEHLDRPDQALARIASLLAHGGRALITVPNEPLVRVARAACRPFMRVDWGGEVNHLHTWSPRRFEPFLRQHLAIEEVAFAPGRLAPIRCCYRCRAHG